MKPILQSFAGRFKGINSTGELQLALSRWYFENKRFAQGYICLAESFVSRILEEYRERDGKISWEEENRNEIKRLLRFKLKKHSNIKYKKLGEIYCEISQIRNTIAHAGFVKNRKFKDDIQNAQTYVKRAEKWFFNNLALKNLPDLFPLKLKVSN